MCCKQGMTYTDIAYILNVSRQRIHQIKTGYKSPRKKNPYVIIPSKIKHPVLKRIPGDTIGYEGRDLTRHLVRLRDKNSCRICGKKWEKGNIRFDIHHLNGECGKNSRGYDSIKDMNGLITLCHKCHLNVDSVRNKMSKSKIK